MGQHLEISSLLAADIADVHLWQCPYTNVRNSSIEMSASLRMATVIPRPKSRPACTGTETDF